MTAPPLAQAPGSPGRLRLVGTPIGNLADVTPGVAAALREADVVCAEDTRRTRRLLAALDVHPARLVSVRAENEARSIDVVVRWLEAGQVVVLVTDAGMPALSDPGARLVRGILDAGHAIDVVAGPDAATAALLVSGLPAARWAFDGFLPRRTAERRRRVEALRHEERSVVVFEAPHRLQRLLAELEDTLGGDRHIAVANDLTKRYERVWRGRLQDVRAAISDDEARGEFVIVVGPSSWRPAGRAEGPSSG